MREMFVTGKTVEEATQAAFEQAEALGFAREDVSVTVEEFPVRRLFKSIPAKVKITLPEEEQPAAPAPAPAAAEPAKKEEPADEPAEPEVKAVKEEKAEEPAASAVEKAEEPAAAPAPAAESEEEIPLDIEADTRLKAARDYLVTVFEQMGVTGTTITAHQQGEASILRVEGENVGALIGRRGETMEALSYLASLVANRQEGDYVKLGLDVAGYRSKREKDLQALARRIGAKVAKSGRSYAMEPMNPYERRIIHSTIGEMEGLRSESKGEGADRRVVVYSTAPNAREGSDRRDRRSSGRDRGPRKDGRRSGSNRGPRREGGRSSVPAREYADRPRDPSAAPIAPKPTKHFNDGESFEMYGKIEL